MFFKNIQNYCSSIWFYIFIQPNSKRSLFRNYTLKWFIWGLLLFIFTLIVFSANDTTFLRHLVLFIYLFIFFRAIDRVLSPLQGHSFPGLWDWGHASECLLGFLSTALSPVATQGIIWALYFYRRPTFSLTLAHLLIFSLCLGALTKLQLRLLPFLLSHINTSDLLTLIPTLVLMEGPLRLSLFVSLCFLCLL